MYCLSFYYWVITVLYIYATLDTSLLFENVSPFWWVVLVSWWCSLKYKILNINVVYLSFSPFIVHDFGVRHLRKLLPNARSQKFTMFYNFSSCIFRLMIHFELFYPSVWVYPAIIETMCWKVLLIVELL